VREVLLVDMTLHCDLQGYMGESAACAYASALSRASVARSVTRYCTIRRGGARLESLGRINSDPYLPTDRSRLPLQMGGGSRMMGVLAKRIIIHGAMNLKAADITKLLARGYPEERLEHQQG
jgi:hypothetical protein